MTILNVQDLQFTYPQTPVLQGLSLSIKPGEHIGVIGPNGAGKTTFFHTICGVLKPTGGQITLYGEPIKAGQFHPRVGLVFQYPDDQLFSPTVWDDVAFGPLNMGLAAEVVDERVTAALTETGMLSFKDRAPHHLSGGQKRMVAIAGIRAMQPELVLYDEPSANLDMRARRQLIEFIKQSSETILLSSHDLEMVLEVSSRVILIDDGQIIADGDPIKVMGDDALMEAHGLERPHSLRPHIHQPNAEIHLHS